MRMVQIFPSLMFEIRSKLTKEDEEKSKSSYLIRVLYNKGVDATPTTTLPATATSTLTSATARCCSTFRYSSANSVEPIKPNSSASTLQNTSVLLGRQPVCWAMVVKARAVSRIATVPIRNFHEPMDDILYFESLELLYFFIRTIDNSM